MTATLLHERLSSALGKQTYRSLSRLTGTHPETVRRYMQGGTPSPEFLSEVCRVLSISGDWLLTGRGAMKVEEIQAQALRDATAVDLLAGLTGSMQVLIERIERLEVFVQTLDTRTRQPGGRRLAPSASHDTGQGEKLGADGSPAAGRIGRALAERSPEDAD